LTKKINNNGHNGPKRRIKNGGDVDEVKQDGQTTRNGQRKRRQKQTEMSFLFDSYVVISVISPLRSVNCGPLWWLVIPLVLANFC